MNYGQLLNEYQSVSDLLLDHEYLEDNCSIMKWNKRKGSVNKHSLTTKTPLRVPVG